MMAVLTPTRSAPKQNALVVCAGTVNIPTVDGMGEGFNFFKDTFGRNAPWTMTLQGYLDNHFNHGQSMPAYITLNNAIKPRDNLLGGVATVPIFSNSASMEQQAAMRVQYEAAVRGAIQAAKNSQPQRPLYIQPLGIGAYGWNPELAASLFAMVIQAEDPNSELDITINIYNTSPGSSDLRFRTAFHDKMLELTQADKPVQPSLNSTLPLASPDEEKNVALNLAMQYPSQSQKAVLALAIGVVMSAIVLAALSVITFGIAGGIVASAVAVGGLSFFALDSTSASDNELNSSNFAP
jgi:hypothetical protein